MCLFSREPWGTEGNLARQNEYSIHMEVRTLYARRMFREKALTCVTPPYDVTVVCGKLPLCVCPSCLRRFGDLRKKHAPVVFKHVYYQFSQFSLLLVDFY